VLATVLHTSSMLEMQVHTVNRRRFSRHAREMDFLLLNDVAPQNHRTHYGAGKRRVLQRFDFSPHHSGFHDSGR